MNLSDIQILSETVTRYDRRGKPVTPTDLAAEIAMDSASIQTRFDALESKHLLKKVEGGYRPTVTARELLELNIDDDALLILDAEPEE